MTVTPCKTNIGSALAGLAVLVAACTGRERHGTAWQDEALPSITVALPESAWTTIGLDTARKIRAPSIRFHAIVRPDPDHTTAITVPGEVALVVASVATARRVEPGDTLARLNDAAPGKGGTLLAPRKGMWWPLLHSGEAAWPGDTVGMLQHEGRFVAVGYVEALESRMVQMGDSVALSRPSQPGLILNGRVESIVASRYGVEVAAHFHRADDSSLAGALVEVGVIPSSVSDSVMVVPTQSIVQLSRGSAIFIPSAAGTFSVRFVITDPHEVGVSVVHQGLDAPALVAVSGLSLLAAAAEDSIRVRASRPR